MYHPKADILPTSVPKVTRNVTFQMGRAWIPIYCANCGADGGRVPQDASDFAFYLCQPCADKHGEIAGHMMVPDEVFWQRVKDAQLEKYGRELEGAEVAEELRDPDSLMSKLARDRR